MNAPHAHKPGARVKVHNCFGGYVLPAGLPEGATVSVVSFEIGYYHVEFQGERYRVAMACVELPGQNPPTIQSGKPRKRRL